jgi:hypothetical protein
MLSIAKVAYPKGCTQLISNMNIQRTQGAAAGYRESLLWTAERADQADVGHALWPVIETRSIGRSSAAERNHL